MTPISWASIVAWLTTISAWQVVRWCATYAAFVGSLFLGGWTMVKPRAEDFVRSTVQAEKFATHEELEKQSKLLEELTTKFEAQGDVLQQQNTQMGIVQNDLGTLKQSSRDILRAVIGLKNQPDDE